MESAAGYLPGRNLDQHDSGLLQCAFVHAVGGVGGFALPSVSLFQNGATALSLASQKNHITIVTFLLESGAQINKVQHCNVCNVVAYMYLKLACG